MGRLASLALALALTAGCAKPPMVLGQRMPSGCKESSEDERCLGWALDRFLMTIAFREYDDRVVTDYVTAVGNRIARATGDHRDWTFRVLDDPEVNAFAWLGKTVYIERGTLAVLRSEAELAAVLAHEMGHVLGGHAQQAFEDPGRGIERSKEAESKQIRYARDDEIQADELATLLLERAGYDPHAVETMLRALAGTQPDSEDDPDAVHPWWPERIARAQALVTARRTGDLGGDRYLDHMRSLIVGNDPRFISISGTTVVFGRAKVGLDLPAPRASALLNGVVTVAFEGQIAQIRIIPAALVTLAPSKQTGSDDSATEARVAGSIGLLVSVDGKHAQRRVKQLLAAIRPARPGELADLHPTRADLHAPRTLWSR